MNAIFHKEWIKTRWYFLFSFITTMGFSAYCMLRISRAVELKGIEHIWGVMLSRDVIFIDLLQFIPVIIGILLALVQFVPEMHQKCLKLTLHLPCSGLKMIGLMLLFSVVLLSLCFALNLLFLNAYLDNILALELKRHVILTALPWYLAGIAGYLFVSWICLEPTWKRRIINSIVSLLVLRIFFLSSTPEAYNYILPVLLIYTVLSSSFVWISIVRFKNGKQD